MTVIKALLDTLTLKENAVLAVAVLYFRVIVPLTRFPFAPAGSLTLQTALPATTEPEPLSFLPG